MQRETYLTEAEAAAWMNVPTRFIRRLRAERRLPYVRAGRHVRIALSDLDTFMQAGRCGGDPVSGRAGRCGFGAIRKLPSGRYQMRYLAPDGLYRSAPQTFATRTDADRFLAKIQADMDRGSWIDPDLGRVTLHAYADRWLADRTSLRPRTRELYAGLLRRHVLPELGEVRLRDLAPAVVRSGTPGCRPARVPAR